MPRTLDTTTWTPSDLDLRRVGRRETLQTLVQRAATLPAEDRILIEAYFRDGRSFPEIARERRQTAREDDVRPTARVLARRLRRLVTRLTDPRYGYVESRLASGGRGWSALRQAVARRGVMLGQSQRDIARDMRVSVHAVRSHLQAVAAECDALTHAARSPRSAPR